ncbi:hypothetical protein RHGRI_030859 [Rhododendron griersonianum]|uniref:Uncharacterized protein n=1 Tax=Rhododendron griersonianum TaxID=479676 RepID=A0AAV6I8U0_9ERIC|nr:hypothetical protein RHGRI_030859 [Rhododendron griersonianum]
MAWDRRPQPLLTNQSFLLFWAKNGCKQPPNPNHQEWDTIRHPKIPAEGWYAKISISQKRRLQRKFASRIYDGPLDHVNDPMRPIANMVWTRELGESKGKKELKQKMEEFQKLMEDDDDNLLDESDHDQDELIRDATPSPQKPATFGEGLATIQFGSVPSTFQCNMILVLPK